MFGFKFKFKGNIIVLELGLNFSFSYFTSIGFPYIEKSPTCKARLPFREFVRAGSQANV